MKTPSCSGCSYLSHYDGDYYSHGLCLWVDSSSGPVVSVCYCESGYCCSMPTIFHDGAGEPNACVPDARRLLELMEREVVYIDVACELVSRRQLNPEAAFAAIEICAERLDRYRVGLQHWHDLNAGQVPQKKAAKKSAKKKSAKKSGGKKSGKKKSKANKKA